MKLNKLEIVNLFDNLNYSLDFSEYAITAITGPNGYGKTVILKIINSFISADLDFFINLDFFSIKFEFDKFSCLIKKKDRLEIKFFNGIDDFSLYNYPDLNPIKIKEKGSLINLYQDELIEKKNIEENNYSIKNKIIELMSDFSCVFIRDQRLFSVATNNNESSLPLLARNLSDRIKKCVVSSREIANKLDSSFPMRIFYNDSSIIFHEVEEKLNGIKLKQDKYIKYGFLDDVYNFSNSFDDFDFSKKQDNKHVLDLYVKDTLEKYEPFVNLTEQIDLFVRLINLKGMAFKKILVNKEYGFKFESKNNKNIPLDKLSSGEQNQIIMIYNLIFFSNSSSLILIDEPEISLHIAWQKQIYSNLERIAKINRIPQIIMATHTPTVFDNNWNQSIDLYEISMSSNG